jgi:hypothetical protein
MSGGLKLLLACISLIMILPGISMLRAEDAMPCYMEVCFSIKYLPGDVAPPNGTAEQCSPTGQVSSRR